MKVIDEGTRTLFARRVRSCAALSNGLSSAWLVRSGAKFRPTRICAPRTSCAPQPHILRKIEQLSIKVRLSDIRKR